MSTLVAGTDPLSSPSGSLLDRTAWHWRSNPKLELWLAWWAMVIFYQLFGLVFFVITRTQPPPNPAWALPRVVQWFNDNHYGLLVGFGIIFMVAGMVAACNALIAYSIRRMSVSRAFAYSYIAIYSLSTVPGMLVTCIALTVGAMRPERDPELISWLYDLAFMAFDGTMGVFLIGTSVWMVAILIDKNRVMPKWFAYLNLCNALTEVVVAPAWIFKDGVFAWDGVVTYYINMVVFITYTTAFIVLLRKMILREDFGAGRLPDLSPEAASAQSASMRTQP
jgi:hypothetical protein